MNEEAMVYKLMIKFDLDYDYSLALIMSISNRNLLQHLFMHFEEFDTYEKFYKAYF